MKAFPIDFVRQVIEQTLLEQHKLNQDLYYGGKDQVNLFSFYEQLQKDSEVDRYVEIYRDLGFDVLGLRIIDGNRLDDNGLRQPDKDLVPF